MNNNPFTQPIQAGNDNFYGDQPAPQPQSAPQPTPMTTPTMEPMQQYQPQAQPEQSMTPKKKSKVGLIIVIVTIIILAIFSAIGFFVFSTFKTVDDSATTTEAEKEQQKKEQEEYDSAKIVVSHDDKKMTIYRKYADTLKGLTKDGYSILGDGPKHYDSETIDNYLNREGVGLMYSDSVNDSVSAEMSDMIVIIVGRLPAYRGRANDGQDEEKFYTYENDEVVKLKHLDLNYVSFDYSSSDEPLIIGDKKVYLNKTSISEFRELFGDSSCETDPTVNIFNYNNYSVEPNLSYKDKNIVSGVTIYSQEVMCADDFLDEYGD